MRKLSYLILMLLLTSISYPSFAAPATKPLGLRLEGYRYPYPVKFMLLRVENKNLQMAYMDVPARGDHTKGVVLLLHGGLAMGAYWKDTISYLSRAGYRVIVPDQLGFGKSSKEIIDYSFDLLAHNTKLLLQYLHVKKMVLIGHSMGGMLAIRFSLKYPHMVKKLVLEDPLGLEDYQLYIPYKSSDQIYKLSLNPSWQQILNQHKALYATWKNKFGKYAEVAYRVTLNQHYSKLARVQALIYEMLYSEPVIYEIHKLAMPTLILFGEKDSVAPGKGFATKTNQKKLGNIPHLAISAARKIKNAQYKMFKDVGHVAHLEATPLFNQTVLDFISH